MKASPPHLPTIIFWRKLMLVDRKKKLNKISKSICEFLLSETYTDEIKLQQCLNKALKELKDASNLLEESKR